MNKRERPHSSPWFIVAIFAGMLLGGVTGAALGRELAFINLLGDLFLQALKMLIEISRSEEDPEIRRDAVFWIGQFDTDEAAEYLLEVINEE